MTLKPVWRPSPNYETRQQPLKYIILHGTWMDSTEEALERLCDKEAKVSCHYVIDEEGQLFQLAEDEHVTWHSGTSAWREDVSLNYSSIGIEISHSGNVNVPYTDSQYSTLIELMQTLISKHSIPLSHVLGHSDISPDRKNDPGPQFNWSKLYNAKVAEPLCKGFEPSVDELKAIGYVGSAQHITQAYKLRLGIKV
jgi:N-acetylmuramoyl-L-alanine amidase